MDGDKEVGLGIVGNLGSLPEFQKTVGLAGIYDLHVRTVLLNDASESICIAQGQRFLVHRLSLGTSVLTAVTGINYNRKALGRSIHRQGETKEQNQ